MPTLTPHEIDRPRHTTDDIGSGTRPPTRPPTDKRTGGNGDGDNWNNRPQGSRGPRERLSQARVGLFFALGGDLMFFVALVSVFFVTKASGHFDTYSHYSNEWLPTAIPSILWLNTAVFYSVPSLPKSPANPCSVSMTLWTSGSFRQAHYPPRHALAFADVASSVPCSSPASGPRGTSWPPSTSSSAPTPAATFSISSPSPTPSISSSALQASSPRSWVLRRSRSLSTRQVLVDSTVWYWHVMGILWIFLFLLLEYGQ